MKIHYVTSNKGKFEEAALILEGVHLIHTPLHLDELQGTKDEIALHKIREAYNKLQEPCLIDDVALFCPALGGLPGPYIRPFLEALDDKGLAALISHYTDHSCNVCCTVAFQAGKTPLLFEGIVEGKIVSPRGSRKHHKTSWNAIVEPNGSTYTFAEMTLEEMSSCSPRYKALTNLKNHLKSS